jgi:hypothetical protein
VRFAAPALQLDPTEVIWRHSTTYVSDLTTKVTHGDKPHQLVDYILYDIYDDHPRQ